MGFNLWAVWGASSQISLHLTPIGSDQQSSNNKRSDNEPLESQKLSIISSLCQIERSNRSFYNIVAKEIASGTREKLDIDVRLSTGTRIHKMIKSALFIDMGGFLVAFEQAVKSVLV